MIFEGRTGYAVEWMESVMIGLGLDNQDVSG